MPFFLSSAEKLPCSRKILAIFLLFPLSALSSPAAKSPFGIAWKVQGTWRLEGNATPLRPGDAVPPASLLQPGDDSGGHSITVLLPDGQRVLYECFLPADCARGFRIPRLVARPDAFAIHLLSRIHSVLTTGDVAHSPSRALPPARDEAVAVLDGSHRVRISGLAAQLPNGRYTYDLQAIDPASPAQHGLVFEKTKPAVELSLPAPGLYSITITDAQNNARVSLFLGAIRPAQVAHFQSFDRARERMEDWNGDYAGWPIDDFLRAYLQSLMQSASPTRIAHAR
jgi:hypothetical protein